MSSDLNSNVAVVKKVFAGGKISMKVSGGRMFESISQFQESGEGSATTTDQEILIFLEELDDGSVTTTDRVINGE